MNAKQYLNQVGMLDERIKDIDKTIKKIQKELREIGDISVTSSWPDGQPHGTKLTDPTGQKAISLADKYNAKREQLTTKLTELEYEQIVLRSKLWAKRMEIVDTISRVFDPDDVMSKTYYTLLTMRYIDGKSWEKIAVEIGYTWRHTIRLHGEALKKVENILCESA